MPIICTFLALLKHSLQATPASCYFTCAHKFNIKNLMLYAYTVPIAEYIYTLCIASHMKSEGHWIICQQDVLMLKATVSPCKCIAFLSELSRIWIPSCTWVPVNSVMTSQSVHHHLPLASRPYQAGVGMVPHDWLNVMRLYLLQYCVSGQTHVQVALA